MREPSSTVTALLLCGGESRRMGRDKLRLVIDGGGLTLAERNGRLLSRAVETALEVGPGVSGLASIMEEPRGQGPLVAIAAGYQALQRRGHDGPALVIAGDLALLTEELLALLRDWDGPGSAVPVVNGRLQPLCAKWCAHDLRDAEEHVKRGVRSLRYLATQPRVTLLDESAWGQVATATNFADVDSPADLDRLGLVT
ncbi:MAG: NTP transferase domain-containing protein [Acidobacteriota bacterium]|nr:NTP transferase domain-containing protein [Acidobacteriota bacterium]